MPKLTLSFKLPEESEDFKLAQSGAELNSAVDEFDNWLRSKIKYDTLTPLEYEIYRQVRDKLWEFRNE